MSLETRSIHYLLLHPTNDISEVQSLSISDAALGAKNGTIFSDLATLVKDDIHRRWKLEFDPEELIFYPVEGVIHVREVKPDLRERLKAMCISSRVCQKAANVKFDLKAEEDDSLLDFLVTVGPNLEREQPSHPQASTDVEPADHVARLWHRFERVIGAATTKGRVMDGWLNRKGPPIKLYHPVFSKFRADATDVNKEVTDEMFRATFEFMQSASEFKEYASAMTRRLLSDLMGRELIQVNLSSSPHHCVLVSRDESPKGTVVPLLIEESEIGADLYTQAGLSFLQYWTDPSRAEIREACCCPTILVALYGPYLCVMGAVLSDKMMVQHLTGWLHIGQEYAFEEELRVTKLARLFMSLADAVNSLCEWYRTTPLVKHDYTRFFPEITSYLSEGKEVQFVYKERLQQHDGCLTFLARIKVNGTEGDPIVVKFVQRYGVEAHELLASEGLAPRLIDFSDLTKRRPGHQYGQTGMVVMEYLQGETLADKYVESAIPDGVRSAFTKTIEILAKEGLVHGDIRRSNVMVLNTEGKEQVRIINFDLSGKEGVVRYPTSLWFDYPSGIGFNVLISVSMMLRW